MAAYCTGLNPIKIGDPRSKVKVTVIENVSQNEEKKNANFKCKHFLNQSLSFDRNFNYCHFDTKYDNIVQ